MKNKLSNRLSTSIKVILAALFTTSFFASNATIHNVSSNTNISAFNPTISNGDTIRVTATLTVNGNKTFTHSNVTLLVDGGTILWTGNHTVTLSGTSQLVLVGGGTLSASGSCNAVKVLTIGTLNATCIGGPGITTFANINTAGGFNQTGSFTPIVSTTPIALPVNLLSFDAKNIENSNNQVVLSWSTAQEINNSHFVVMKSNDGNTWESIATIEGMGNTFENTTYTYTDNSPASVNYYKLIQVDFDGTETNLGIRFVLSNSTITKVEPVLFPNPVQNVLNVKIENAGISNATIEIMDLSGKIIFTQNNEIYEIQTIQISTENFAAGIYTVRITLNNHTSVQRVVKR